MKVGEVSVDQVHQVDLDTLQHRVLLNKGIDWCLNGYLAIIPAGYPDRQDTEFDIEPIYICKRPDIIYHLPLTSPTNTGTHIWGRSSTKYI